VIRLVPEQLVRMATQWRCPRACPTCSGVGSKNVILHVENARRLAGTFEVLADCKNSYASPCDIVLSVMPCEQLIDALYLV